MTAKGNEPMKNDPTLVLANERRGIMTVTDDGETIRIVISPTFGGASLPDRMTWLRDAVSWANEILQANDPAELSRLVR